MNKNLSRAALVGLALAVGGIVLFLVIYVVLGDMGVDALIRVIVALCVPPAVMAALVGGYFLLRPQQATPQPPNTQDRPE